MLIFLINRTKAGLAPEQYIQLAERAKAFYANVPADVQIRGEWAADDYSSNFTLLEAPGVAMVEELSAPFREFVDVGIIPVNEIKGWAAT
jgi:hypothetical protein